MKFSIFKLRFSSGLYWRADLLSRTGCQRRKPCFARSEALFTRKCGEVFIWSLLSQRLVCDSEENLASPGAKLSSHVSVERNEILNLKIEVFIWSLLACRLAKASDPVWVENLASPTFLYRAGMERSSFHT